VSGSRAWALPRRRAFLTVFATDVVMFCLFPSELPPMAGVKEASGPAQTSAAVIAFWGDRDRHRQGGAKTASLTASGDGQSADASPCHGAAGKKGIREALSDTNNESD